MHSGILSGKVAVVTGSGRGIGRATAELLASEGATVVLTARTRGQLQLTEEAINRSGGAACVLDGDLTDEEFVSSLFSYVETELGRLDFLVNNAGVAPSGPVEELRVSLLRQCLEINVVAAFACTQAAVRIMKRRKISGKIVSIGSVRSHWTEAGDSGAYNASKYALRAMTESIARQLHGDGSDISVGLVCPGVVNTPLTNPDGQDRPDWLRPADVAAAVLHALAAPGKVNYFDTTLFPTSQRPW